MWSPIVLLSASLLLVNCADIGDFIAGNKDFTKGFYSEIASSTGSADIVLSPLSVQVLFALLQTGAGGATGEEIRSGLFLPNSTETASVMDRILSTIHTKLANKVYIQDNYTTKADFKSIAEDIYRASFENVEYFDGETTATTINKWVQDQTDKKFGNSTVSSSDLTLTKDLLLNTVLLKQNWSLPFDESYTTTGKFVYPAVTISYNTEYVEMMTQGPTMFNYYESDELAAKFLEIPIRENATFTIVLPNDMRGIPNLENNIEAVLNTPDYSQENIQLRLPKFQIQLTNIGIVDSLEKLGINKAFTSGSADLSGMAGVPNELIAYGAQQSTYITIDENGVEAVAAGPVGAKVASNRYFNVEHPFMFYIKVDGIIVFIGKVTQTTFIN